MILLVLLSLIKRRIFLLLVSEERSVIDGRRCVHQGIMIPQLLIENLLLRSLVVRVQILIVLLVLHLENLNNKLRLRILLLIRVELLRLRALLKSLHGDLLCLGLARIMCVVLLGRMGNRVLLLMLRVVLLWLISLLMCLVSL